MLNKCKRVYQYGVKKSSIIAAHRIQQWCFARYWRRAISSYRPCTLSVQPKQLPFVHTLCQESDHATCIAWADAVVRGQLSVLGSQPQLYDIMPWHTDIRLAQQDPTADAQFTADIFYRDITIASGAGEQLYKDIKVPWELSRAQALPLLGHAYVQTKNTVYAKKIIGWCDDWIQGNPFLYGANWCNPMEVGLRALNWIMAISMIDNSSCMSLSLRKKIVSSLYEHLIFIEGNWEWYDGRTSNHYLSDLVGYLYLSWFFDEQSKFRWAICEFEREMAKQILPDGTSYEGSTRYHRLVAELFYYAQLLINHESIQLSDNFVTKYKQMNAFLHACTPTNGELIAIGDDDSGRVTAFGTARPFVVSAEQREVYRTTHYFKDFGLSVYNSSKLHVTLRHHAYRATQPSGHFHNDVGSITVAVGGIPLIVDPGSFVYTPSAPWRNTFRSVQLHNGSYINGVEPVPLTDQLFYLGLSERANDDALLTVHQAQYANLGAQLMRRIECNDMLVTISDAWDIQKHAHRQIAWNFTLHPTITPHLQDNAVLLMHNNRLIAIMQSAQLTLSIENAYFAPCYGQKKDTKCIRAYAPFATIQTEITIRVEG